MCGLCDMGVFGKGIPFGEVSSGEDGEKRELGLLHEDDRAGSEQRCVVD